MSFGGCCCARKVRGISGGQRKRVNVGLELVADPSVLLLDEPTSGLDSTASRLVLAALQRVARLGVTAAAVVHQPSYEALCLFDDLVLLAKGGVTAYCGPVQTTQEWFEALGFKFPQHSNPADVMLDAVSDGTLPDGRVLDVPGAWVARDVGACAAAAAVAAAAALVVRGKPCGGCSSSSSNHSSRPAATAAQTRAPGSRAWQVRRNMHSTRCNE